MLLQRSGMQAAVAQLVTDTVLQQQINGVICTPCSSSAGILQELHSMLQPQLLRSLNSGYDQLEADLGLQHLAGLVAGAMRELHQQQQQQQQVMLLPVSSICSSRAGDAAVVVRLTGGGVCAEQIADTALQGGAATVAGASSSCNQHAAATVHCKQAGASSSSSTGNSQSSSGSNRSTFNAAPHVKQQHQRQASTAAADAAVAAAVAALELAVVPATTRLQRQHQQYHRPHHPQRQQQEQQQEQQQPVVFGDDMLTLLLNPWLLWHKQGLQQAVQQLPTADPMLQRQLHHLASANAAQHRVLAALRMLLLGRLKQAAAAGVTVEPGEMQLAQLVAAACSEEPAPQEQQQQQKQRQQQQQTGMQDTPCKTVAAPVAECGGAASRATKVPLDQLWSAIDAAWPLNHAALAAARAGQPLLVKGALSALLRQTTAQLIAQMPGRKCDLSALAELVGKSEGWAPWKCESESSSAAGAAGDDCLLAFVREKGDPYCLHFRKELQSHPAFALWVESERSLERLRYKHVKRAEVVALHVNWLMENSSRHQQQPEQQQQQQGLWQQQQQQQQQQQPSQREAPLHQTAAAIERQPTFNADAAAVRVRVSRW
jgi:hypothetical protein